MNNLTGFTNNDSANIELYDKWSIKGCKSIKLSGIAWASIICSHLEVFTNITQIKSAIDIATDIQVRVVLDVFYSDSNHVTEYIDLSGTNTVTLTTALDETKEITKAELKIVLKEDGFVIIDNLEISTG